MKRIDEWEKEHLIFEHHEAAKFLRQRLGTHGITQADVNYHIERKKYWKR